MRIAATASAQPGHEPRHSSASIRAGTGSGGASSLKALFASLLALSLTAPRAARPRPANVPVPPPRPAEFIGPKPASPGERAQIAPSSALSGMIRRPARPSSPVETFGRPRTDPTIRPLRDTESRAAQGYCSTGQTRDKSGAAGRDALQPSGGDRDMGDVDVARSLEDPSGKTPGLPCPDRPMKPRGRSHSCCLRSEFLCLPRFFGRSAMAPTLS